MCNCKLMLFLKVLWHNLHVVGPIFSSAGWGVVLVKMAAVRIEKKRLINFRQILTSLDKFVGALKI